MGKLIEIVNDNARGAKLGSLNLKQYAQRKAAHVEACKALVAAKEKYGLPITILVYLGVSKQAHRINVVKQGYTNFDEKKVATIAKWMKMFATHSNDRRLAKNADVAHALCTYYDKVSKKSKDFKAALEASQPITWEHHPYKAAAKALGIEIRNKE